MIQTKISQITTTLDGLTISYGLRILRGSTKQTLYKDSGEYADDRTIPGIGCLLMPFVSVKDNDNAMSGEQPIVDVVWYEGDVTSANNISADTAGYKISGTGNPKYSLDVQKNVPADKPMQINCVFKFQDTRKGSVVTCEANVTFVTAIYSDNNYNVKVDQPTNFSINPLNYADNNVAWMQTVNAQLYDGTEAVPDANAYYQWEVLDNGTWRKFNAEEIDTLVTINGRQLQVDARYISQISTRVKAVFYKGTAPTSIAADNIIEYCTINVAMPYGLTMEISQTKGMKIGANMNTQVEFACQIYDSKKEVVDKDNFFRIKWFVKSAKSGSTELLLGEGKTISFNPSMLGLDATYSMGVFARVYSYTKTAFIVGGTGLYLTGANGELLTTKIFE